MPQIIDHAYSTLSSGVTAAATSWPLVSGSSFPDPANGQYWVRIWNSTDYSDPKDDPQTEECRVTAKVSNTLTVVRGEDGETAYDHNTGGKTYAVAIMMGRRNVRTSTGYDDCYNVIDYGADPTGAATSTTAIQAAIDAANTAGGGVVFIPKGTYNCDQLTLYADITLQGVGKENTSIVAKTASATEFIVNDSTATNRRNIQFRDLELQLSTSGNSATTIIRFCNMAYSSIRDCRFQGNSVGSSTGIEFDAETSKNTYYNIVDGCTFLNFTTCIVCENRANSQRFTNNVFLAFTTGIKVDESNQIYIAGNAFGSTFTTGIEFTGSTPSLTYSCVAICNRFENGTTGISIGSGTYSSHIIGNHYSAMTNEYVDSGAAVDYTILEDRLNSLALIGSFAQWMRTPTYSSAFPSPTSTYDRVFLHDPKDGSTPAKWFICMQRGSGTYEWRQIYTLEGDESMNVMNTGLRIFAGSGTPESAVTAPVGSLYMRSDGGADTTLYTKESGTGNTGWAAVTT